MSTRDRLIEVVAKALDDCMAGTWSPGMSLAEAVVDALGVEEYAIVGGFFDADEGLALYRIKALESE